MERIYRTLHGHQLQSWLRIIIERDEAGDATVSTYSDIHVGKKSPVSFSWGAGFTDADILYDDDLLRVVYQRYGREIFAAQFTREI